MAFQPSWVRINDGSRFSFTTRDSEKITSSGRSGLPLANLASGRRVKVRLRLSLPACHSLASVGLSSIGFLGSDWISRW
ncbi:hypothetical protein D3C71_1812120 [compost metagenome]